MMTELKNLLMRLETAHLIAELAKKIGDKPATPVAGKPKRFKCEQSSRPTKKKLGWCMKAFEKGAGNRSKPNPKPGSLKNPSEDKEQTKCLGQKGHCFRSAHC
jgi:hypothetical protein